jgi:hypothetical protein
MAVGLPSRFPDSFIPDDLHSPTSDAAQEFTSDPCTRLTQEEITAIREFFLLLDKWDRQKKAT